MRNAPDFPFGTVALLALIAFVVWLVSSLTVAMPEIFTWESNPPEEADTDG